MDEKADSRYHSELRDESSYLYATHPQPSPSPARGWAIYYRDRTLRRLFTAACLTTVAWVMINSYVASLPTDTTLRWTHSLSEGEASLKNASTNKVPLEAHIMSKCPDARACLQELVVPAMEKIHDKVDFQLSYIGSIDNHSDAVSCKHGPTECLGNMILLCAAYLYPDPIISLGFANCMIAEYDDIPARSLVEDCALEHGVDFDKVNKCLSNEDEAIEMLRNSVERSDENNVTLSCTVRLAGDFRCIRDGGEWKQCEDGHSVKSLVGDVEKLYDDMN